MSSTRPTEFRSSVHLAALRFKPLVPYCCIPRSSPTRMGSMGRRDSCVSSLHALDVDAKPPAALTVAPDFEVHVLAHVVGESLHELFGGCDIDCLRIRRGTHGDNCVAHAQPSLLRRRVWCDVHQVQACWRQDNAAAHATRLAVVPRRALLAHALIDVLSEMRRHLEKLKPEIWPQNTTMRCQLAHHTLHLVDLHRKGNVFDAHGFHRVDADDLAVHVD
mmetsp:Transcript_24813/g.69920  ORF Transcript_24813/g.69920 Transcript_24813/m.69920 type:complete len:219 (-) Transcript_24813:728-1384(-)